MKKGLVNLTVTGVIKLTSAFHSGASGSHRVDLDTGWVRAQKGEEDKDSPSITAQVTMPVMTPAYATTAQESEEASPTPYKRRDVPVIPANSKRHALRDAAYGHLEEILVASGKKVPLEVIHMLTSGAATGVPDNISPTIPEILEVQDHVFLGLFGGGARMHSSKLRVDTAYPVVPETIGAGLIPPEHHGRAGKLGGMMVPVVNNRRDGVLEGLHGDAMEDYRQAVDAWREELAKDSSQALRRWNYIQVVVPGVSFFARYEARGATMAQAGLLLDSIAGWAEKQVIGAKKSHGMGRFNLEDFKAEVTDHEGNVTIVTDLIRDNKLVADHPLIGEMLEATLHELETLDLAKLVEYAKPKGDGTEKSKEKKVKKSKGEQADAAA